MELAGRIKLHHNTSTTTIQGGKGGVGKKGEGREGTFLVEYLNVVTCGSRNNSLYPDCLSTLEVAGAGGCKAKLGKKEWRLQGRANLHALDLFPLIELPHF